MNLHAIVGPIVAAVNPWITGTLRISTGAASNADFSRTPTFATYPGIPMQVQGISGRELQQLAAQNIQGVVRKVYMNGNVEGLDRPAGKGGDLLIFNNQTWLVTQVAETWDADGWCSVVVTLQNDA